MASAPRSRRYGVIAVVAIAILGLPAQSQPAQGQRTQSQPAISQPVQGRPAQPAAEVRQLNGQVTLITGDRVTLREGRVSVDPGPGREKVRFTTRIVKDQVEVLPSDLGRLFAAGRLDRQLFDVAALIRAGYDDRSTPSIPVVVTYTGKAKSRAAVVGATVTRQLPVLNGVALKIDKAKAGAFLTGTTTAGVQKIWLDAKRKLSLDESVPQIGAPTAWQAGYTGKDVKVAVLDSGVDTSHPDLAGQVVAARNFTDTDDGDRNGHGTHVASTIAGTAAASAGKYKGVAPAARIYDGKVCDDHGDCRVSAILAGMEWAATEVKAKIVNLSLGGGDTPEIDPLEEAVNRLTAQTGTLFVVAAGNEGSGVGTVGSPGSADAALTVGAVDKQDKLAEFSGRGPRVGDGGLKPDVTAPGVGIVAAKSSTSVIGTPVGDRYLRLNGTSMATPHVAGAAALLAQQHPDWDAEALKAALMGSAKPAAGQTLFEQGSGRIDVAKAVQQKVFAEPGSLSFGVVRYPHDDDQSITKPLTYRNTGDQTITVQLDTVLTGPDGKPAPAGAINLSTQSVTVPAGGTVAVQVTINTKHDGPNGAYVGRVTATAGSATVATALAVTKEVEHYTITAEAIDPDGKPGGFEEVMAYNVATGDRTTAMWPNPGPVSFRLPKGEYLLDTSQFIPNPTDPEATGRSYRMVQPRLNLTGDSTVVFDARKAKKVTVTVPRSEAKILSATVGYLRKAVGAEGGLTSMSLGASYDPVYTGQVGPSAEPGAMTGFLAAQWAPPGTDGQVRNAPYVYSHFDGFPGGFPTGLDRAMTDRDFAAVDVQLNKTNDRKARLGAYGMAPGMSWSFGKALEFDQARTVRLLLGGRSAVWSKGFEEIHPDDPGNWATDIRSRYREYRAGTSYRERINSAVFTTAPVWAFRDRNVLNILDYTLMDADGNKGETGIDTQSGRLLRNGEVIAEGLYGDIYAEGVPAEKATYVLESSLTRQTWSDFSTRTDRKWTFTSAATDQKTQLPAIGIRYRPKVGIDNVVERTPVMVLPIVLEAQRDGVLPKIRSVEIRVSGDEGKTWRKASVQADGRGGYRAAFATPKTARSVSLQARIVDSAGFVTEETTIGAYPLR
ncbi:S8 family serine peptidase [Kribbella yunnanensis]|uniref:S8 family serine peptidase n=1 Tax=Kribbella yunnanensis TaxID=190194 RepID=A0ABP4U659_9ACTN